MSNAVPQHRATLVGVEHAGDRADLGDCRHAGQQGGTVLEQQAHRIPLFHALLLQYIRDAVGPGIEVAVVPALAFEQQAFLVRNALCLVFQDRPDRLMAFRGDRVELQGRPQRAHGRGQEPQRGAAEIQQSDPVVRCFHCRILHAVVHRCRRYSPRAFARALLTRCRAPDQCKHPTTRRDRTCRTEVFRVRQAKLWHRPETPGQGSLVYLLTFQGCRIETPVLFWARLAFAGGLPVPMSCRRRLCRFLVAAAVFGATCPKRSCA